MQRTMTQLNEYVIPIGGLALGQHEYTYSIDSSFFKAIDNSEVESGKVEMRVRLEKQTTMAVVDFEQLGNVQVNCDRCGDVLEHSINATNQLVIKFNDADFNDNDDVVILNELDNRFDLTHYFYEYIHLEIPLKRLHADTECNPDVLRKLEELQGVKNDPAYVDPRWEELKNIN